MKNTLQLLIEELQKEHDFYEQEMNACIKEWDFINAAAFKKPIFNVREQLRILNNLDNPEYDKIYSLKGRIEQIKNMEVNNPILSYWMERMKDKTAKYEKELSALESKGRKPYCDNDVLMRSLEKVITAEIKQFEIKIEDGDITIEISKKENSLIIEIRNTSQYSLKSKMSPRGFAEMKKLGFQINDQHAIKEICEFQAKNIPQVIEFLARITFDVFRLYGNREAEIIMKE